MIFSQCLRRCINRKLPSWLKCKQCALRFTPAKLGIMFTFTVNATTGIVNEQKKVESMSSESLIENASSDAVTTVSKLLVLSVATLVQRHENYRKAIEHSLSLMDHIIIFINSESHQEELWTEMIAARAKIDECKKDVIDMQSFVENVEKLVIAAVETALLAGSEYSSVTLSEAFTSAQHKILCEQSKTRNLEAEYLKQQQHFIVNFGSKGQNVTENDE